MNAATTHHLVAGFGVTGQAVTRALLDRGEEVVVIDDRPSESARAAAADLGVDIVVAPDGDALDRLVRHAAAVIPAPGVPDRHPALAAAAAHGVPVLSEFDLAGRWDERPLVAVTGTDGKTTVTTLVTSMLEASGRRAMAVGNTDVPLVAALGDGRIEVFVVEASSFRLGRSRRFAPDVGTWLNFAPDHLDVHADLDGYERAKSRIWADQAAEQVAIGNLDDPVVARHLAAAPGRRVGFGTGGDYEVRGPELVGPDGVLARVDDLPRRFPHDLSNALAAAASALEAGATPSGVRQVLHEFRGLPHRLQLVAEAGGIRWFDDSKATVPHAAITAVRTFPSVVLIAGGRNKGLDLAPLAEAADHIRSVIAIGEAASDVSAAFAGIRPVTTADTMDRAVELAGQQARPGDAVVLAPACASFDWYASYGARGDDFARAVRSLLEIA